MRLFIVAAVAAVSGTLIAGCTTTTHGSARQAGGTFIPRPLVERELPALLLTPEQVNSVMGASAMAVVDQNATMSTGDGTVAPRECLAIDDAADSLAYAASGFWAERDQSLNDGDRFTHYVKQAVVLFPTVDAAQAFLVDSAQRWPVCTHFTHVQTGTQWTVGPATATGDALSTASTQLDAGSAGWGCGRALAWKNNIVVDINTCSAAPADSAVQIARQISDNIAARW